MILISICRILNGLSDEINLFWRCSSPLRCGNIESVRRVLSKPRFEQPEALLIHVGVNDIENDQYDAKYIADNLISLA